MRRPPLPTILTLGLLPLLAAAPAPKADYATEIKRQEKYNQRTPSHLAEIQTALAVPATHLTALRELLDFSSSHVFPPDPLRMQANRSIAESIDAPTLTAALNSTDSILQAWAMRYTDKIQDNPATLPRLETLAQGPDETLRVVAAEALQKFPRATDFLAQRAAIEKSPYVLEKILFIHPETDRPRFRAKILSLLADPDPFVREPVVNYVGGASDKIPADLDLMDALMTCAIGDGYDASPALILFTRLSDYPTPPFGGGPGVGGSKTVAHQWWNDHRLEWASAHAAKTNSEQSRPR